MYIGVTQNNGYVVHDYVATGYTIAEVVEKMKKLFTETGIIDEFDEEEITFYSAKELNVKKLIEYVILHDE